jgi:hypothetical protein
MIYHDPAPVSSLGKSKGIAMLKSKMAIVTGSTGGIGLRIGVAKRK